MEEQNRHSQGQSREKDSGAGKEGTGRAGCFAVCAEQHWWPISFSLRQVHSEYTTPLTKDRYKRDGSGLLACNLELSPPSQRIQTLP